MPHIFQLHVAFLVRPGIDFPRAEGVTLLTASKWVEGVMLLTASKWDEEELFPKGFSRSG